MPRDLAEPPSPIRVPLVQDDRVQSIICQGILLCLTEIKPELKTLPFKPTSWLDYFIYLFNKVSLQQTSSLHKAKLKALQSGSAIW